MLEIGQVCAPCRAARGLLLHLKPAPRIRISVADRFLISPEHLRESKASKASAERLKLKTPELNRIVPVGTNALLPKGGEVKAQM